ncbi:MAG TPA: hypothetical protein VI341_13055, partial [Actinomycetota bacterium]
QEGSEALDSAREEADRVLAGLSARRETLVGQLQEMQSRLLGVAKDLEAVIEDPSSEAVAEVEVEVEAEAEADSDAMAEEASTSNTSETDEDELLDPRYEDLWVSAEGNTASTEAEVQFEDLFADDDDASDPDPSSDPDTGSESDADEEDGSMDLPDLASIELDFEEERPDTTD